MTDLVTKSNAQAKEVSTHVGSIIGSIDSISVATGDAAGLRLPPAPAPAPTTPPPAAK
jgi:hypothetical protein